MQSPRRETQVFIISFCFSLIILGSLLLGSTLLFRVFFSEKEEAHDAALQSTVVETENLSVLLIGCRTLSEAPSLIWQVTYNGKTGELTFVVLSPEKTVSTDGRTDTLAEHYDYGGILQLRRAAQAATGLLCDRYIRLEQEGIAALCDLLGGLDVNLEETFSIDAEVFLAGKQHLSGRKLAALLLISGENANQTQREWGELLLSKKLSVLPDSFFDVLFAYADTNLTRYDLLLRQAHFQQTEKERRVFFLAQE